MVHLRLCSRLTSWSVPTPPTPFTVCSPVTLRDTECLVVCPFRSSFSSSCCEIQWIVTQLLHLCCCMTAFIRMKSPVGLKWSLLLNGRSSGSRCLLRIPLEGRGRASMPVRIALHTDTLPKATEEISQLRLKMTAIWQPFCLVLWRCNQTCELVTRLILRNQCLKKCSYFSAVSHSLSLLPQW